MFKKKLTPTRLMVRTQAFQACNQSSILWWVTISGNARVGELGQSVKLLALCLSRFESYLPDQDYLRG